MIGNLDKQYVFNPATGDGTHYSFRSHDKETRLKDIFESLKRHHHGLTNEEKKMIRDLCLMLANTSMDKLTDETPKSQVLRFATGYLLGKYAANTQLSISAENVRIVAKDLEDNDPQG